MKMDAPNLNALWCQLLMEELARQNVTYVGIAPGSRSAPLAVAAAAHPRIRTVVHADERALAFHVLGWGRAVGRPAAIITTSGTAVANLAPAVMEASRDHIPLLLLTADRPPELRDTAANQTLDQVKLFGSHVRWQFDLPCPSAELPLRMLLSTVDQAVARAHRGFPGPVHLNCMFREPLAPLPSPYPARRLLAPLRGWLASGQPLTNYLMAEYEATEIPVAIPEPLRHARRGVILAGPLKPDDAQATVRLGERLGWPVLPDIQSGLRLGAHGPAVIPYADLALGSSTWAAAHQPDAVLLVGGRMTSKRLAALGETLPGASVVRVTPLLERQDPAHRVDTHWCGEVAKILDSLTTDLVPSAPPAWLRAWQQANRTAGAALEQRLKTARGLHEPALAWTLSRRMPEDHALFIGNSLPIRLFDSFACASAARTPAAANRGVSGIDGLLSTATGFAVGRNKPVTAVLGDLSLLHDLNALALLRAAPVPVVLVVLNNDGGGIFSFLPVSGSVRDFERLFAVPHGCTFAGAASMFGLPYRRVNTLVAFRRAYDAACRSRRSAILEVTVDRRKAPAAWRAMQRLVAARLRA